MKKSYITLIVVLITVQFQCFAQTVENKEKFNEDVLAFLQTAVDRDWNALLDYTYSKLFDLQPREKMLIAIEQAYDSKGLKMIFKDFEKDKENTFFKVDSLSFGLTNYSNTLLCKFIKQDDQTKKEFQDYVNLMDDIYKQQFKNAEIKREESEITIKDSKPLLGIYDMSQLKWTFMELSETSSQLLSLLFQQDVASRIMEKAKLKR